MSFHTTVVMSVSSCADGRKRDLPHEGDVRSKDGDPSKRTKDSGGGDKVVEDGELEDQPWCHDMSQMILTASVEADKNAKPMKQPVNAKA